MAPHRGTETSPSDNGTLRDSSDAQSPGSHHNSSSTAGIGIAVLLGVIAVVVLMAWRCVAYLRRSNRGRRILQHRTMYARLLRSMPPLYYEVRITPGPNIGTGPGQWLVSHFLFIGEAASHLFLSSR